MGDVFSVCFCAAGHAGPPGTSAINFLGFRDGIVRLLRQHLAVTVQRRRQAAGCLVRGARFGGTLEILRLAAYPDRARCGRYDRLRQPGRARGAIQRRAVDRCIVPAPGQSAS